MHSQLINKIIFDMPPSPVRQSAGYIEEVYSQQ